MIYDKLPIVFLSTMASEKKGSTNQQIASYILAHLDEVRTANIKELAAMCHVAVSSISRFCKEIGLRDFAELKELLVLTNFHFEKYNKATYRHQIDESLDLVDQSLNEQQLLQLVKDIAHYQKVSIFGLLKASSVAYHLQTDLLMLGKPSYSHVSYFSQIETIQNATKEDLIIIFSYTGSYFDSASFDLLKNDLRAPKIWMISGAKKELPYYVDEVMHFDSNLNQASHPYQLQYIEGLIAQTYASYIQKDRRN